MKSSITKIKNSLEVSTKDVSRQKKQSVNVGINEQSLRELQDTVKHTSTHVMVTPGGEARKEEAEGISVSVMAKQFPSLVKYMSLHSREAQRTPRRIHAKIYTELHCTQMSKPTGKERILEKAKEKQFITYTKYLQ